MRGKQADGPTGGHKEANKRSTGCSSSRLTRQGRGLKVKRSDIRGSTGHPPSTNKQANKQASLQANKQQQSDGHQQSPSRFLGAALESAFTRPRLPGNACKPSTKTVRTRAKAGASSLKMVRLVRLPRGWLVGLRPWPGTTAMIPGTAPLNLEFSGPSIHETSSSGDTAGAQSASEAKRSGNRNTSATTSGSQATNFKIQTAMPTNPSSVFDEPPPA